MDSSICLSVTYHYPFELYKISSNSNLLLLTQGSSPSGREGALKCQINSLKKFCSKLCFINGLHSKPKQPFSQLVIFKMKISSFWISFLGKVLFVNSFLFKPYIHIYSPFLYFQMLHYFIFTFGESDQSYQLRTEIPSFGGHRFVSFVQCPWVKARVEIMVSASVSLFLERLSDFFPLPSLPPDLFLFLGFCYVVLQGHCLIKLQVVLHSACRAFHWRLYNNSKLLNKRGQGIHWHNRQFQGLVNGGA